MGRRTLAAIAVAGISVAWAGWLAATPVVAAAHPGEAALVAVAATYRAGGLLCHQHPDRSFHWGDVQTPVCARCLGLYGGGAMGAVIGLAWLFCRERRRAGRDRIRLTHLRILLLAAAAPTAALWAGEHLAGVGMSNVTRCAGALPLGMAVAAFVVAWIGGASFDDPPARAID